MRSKSKTAAITIWRYRLNGAFIAIGVVTAAYTMYAMTALDQHLRSLGQFHSPALYAVQHIQSQLTGAVQEGFAYITSGQLQEKEEFLSWAEGFSQSAEAFRGIAHLDGPAEVEERDLFESIVSSQAALVESANALFEEFEATNKVSTATFNRYELEVDFIISTLDELIAVEKREVDEYQQLAVSIVEHARGLFLLTLMAATLTLVIGVIITRNVTREVTLRDRAEGRLQESEDRFRQIAENVGEVFFLTDAHDNSAIYVSPAYEDIWRRPVETRYADPQSWQEAVHHEDRARVKMVLDQHRRGHEQYSNEYRIVRPDGSIRWIHDSVFPVKNEAGEVYRVAGISQDITQRKQAEEALQVKTDQLAAVTEAMTAFLEDGDCRVASTRILRNALSQTNSVYGFVGAVVDGPVLRILAHEGITWDAVVGREFYDQACRTYAEQGFLEFTNFENLFGKVITARAAVISNDPAHDHRSGGLPGGHPSLDHFLGVPILRGSKVVGLIGVANRPGGYSPTERSKIEILCRATAVVFDSYRQREREQVLQRKRVQAEEALRDSEERSRKIFEDGPLGMAVVGLDYRLLKVNTALCRMLGYTPQELANLTFPQITHPDDVDEDVRLAEELFNGDIPQFRVEKRYITKDGNILWANLTASVIRDRDGTPLHGLGMIEDISERKLAETEREDLHRTLVERTEELETQKAQLVEEVAQRLGAENQLRHEAMHDALTGLSNRALLVDGLARCIERAKRNRAYKFALLFLDLDRFKVINDSLGHTIGDQLLVGIAERLQRSLRLTDTVARAEEETVARLGGDEFVILLDDISDAADASRVAQRIQEELSEPFHLSGHEVATAASIGIALSESGYDDAEDMLRDADTAMYRAKAAGKARHAVFDKAMHAQAMARLQLENDLRRAIELQQLRLLYQPIVSLQSGRLNGFEALLRWDHPRRGVVGPDEFIPVAEETGLIVPIGRWVLTEACRQLRSWRSQHTERSDEVSISVNVSKWQVSEGGLVEEVQRILHDTGVPGANLRLEITESVIMENPETVSHVLQELTDLGLRLHMDDFGTGYSSLSYLHRFPFDVLKIDRAFVTTMQSNREYAAVVHAIITLAHNLNMKVIAEGIETPEHLAQILALDCDYGQGFFFSKPLAAEEAGEMIERRFLSRQSA